MSIKKEGFGFFRNIFTRNKVSDSNSVKNYKVTKSGFSVRDKSTGHLLEVVLDGKMFRGFVFIPDQGLKLPLAPWPTLSNPFQDDSCFKGDGRGPNGRWWFSIQPSSPFSEIMMEVEALNSFRRPTPNYNSADKRLTENEPWMSVLCKWADDLGLEELRWEVQPRNRDGGFWVGFPRDPQKIVELEGLSIQSLGLSDLPKELGNLKSLKKLWVSHNKLKAIPREICNLTLLEDVRFSDNEISVIPDEIGNLKNLIILDLENNKLNYIPESIRNLKKLERFDIRDQPIDLGSINTPLTDSQVRAIASLGDIVYW